METQLLTVESVGDLGRVFLLLITKHRGCAGKELSVEYGTVKGCETNAVRHSPGLAYSRVFCPCSFDLLTSISTVLALSHFNNFLKIMCRNHADTSLKTSFPLQM